MTTPTPDQVPSKGANTNKQQQQAANPNKDTPKDNNKKKGRYDGLGRQRHNKEPTFKGAVKDMEGFVFECFEETTNRLQFCKTLEQLKRYAGMKCKQPQDMTNLWEMKTPSIALPTELTQGTDEIKKLILEQLVKSYVERTNVLEGNMVHIFEVVWGQCSEAMRAKLQAMEHFETWKEQHDCAALLKAVESVCNHFETQKNLCCVG